MSYPAIEPRDPAQPRHCKKCDTTKPATEFYKDRTCTANSGLQYACKECMKRKVTDWYYENYDEAKAQRKQWRENNRHVTRNRLLKAKYGITSDEYDALLASQGGKCAICGTTEESIKDGRAMPVDHCHATNAVRGVLCSSCNRAIGLLNEDPDRLDRAALYLRSHLPQEKHEWPTSRATAAPSQ